LLASLLAAEAIGRVAAVSVLLAEPLPAALLALPHLALALVLWWRSEVALAFARRPWSVLLLPLLALPYVPAWVGPTHALGSLGYTLLAAGFAAVVAVAVARPPRAAEPPLAGRWLATLGFLPVLTLLWVSWRLAGALPPARLAGLQLGWLLAALGAYLAMGGRARSRWLGGALALAATIAAHLWLAR
jgi:hypothetical protein